MTNYIDIQHAAKKAPPIDDQTITTWACMALDACKKAGEVTIRLVDSAEMTELNTTYRKQPKVTNVLAFPAAIPQHVELDCPLLGDVIICPDVLQEESISLNKSLEAHWALIVLHGVLHLLGYDHIQDKDATIMQGLEISLLAQLGFDNPYLEEPEIE